MNYRAQKWNKAALLLAVYSFLVSLAAEEEEKTPQGEFLIGRLHEVIAMTTFTIIFYVKGDFWGIFIGFCLQGRYEYPNLNGWMTIERGVIKSAETRTIFEIVDKQIIL